MPEETPVDGLSKLQRFGAAQRSGCVKLLRVWVPDPKAPGFQEQDNRQAALLRHAPEEINALHFIETAGDWGSANG